jgi:hypothetical protein
MHDHSSHVRQFFSSTAHAFKNQDIKSSKKKSKHKGFHGRKANKQAVHIMMTSMGHKTAET